MKVLAIDFESTGLLTGEDAITEIGAVLWDVEKKKPIHLLSLFCWDDYLASRMTPETVKMMDELCGLSPETLQRYGKSTTEQINELEALICVDEPEYICAHNGENFDRPLLMATLKRLGMQGAILAQIPWLDTRNDIPFVKEPDSRKLKHLALDIGVINHFPHRAVTDVLTMCLVLSNYDINAVIEYSKIPFITVRMMVEFNDRQFAKDQRFSWENLGDKKYPKCWVKRIKFNKLAEEQAKAGSFKVVQIE